MTGTTGRGGMRRSPKGEAARKLILQSAMRLFSEKGFKSASIADIARDVGMTQAGLLHHFPSKADLLTAVLMERETRNSAETRAAREEGLDALSVFLRTLRNNDRSPALVQLMALLSAEAIPETHPAHDWFHEHYRSATLQTTDEFAAMIDIERLPEGVTPETISRWVVALADGLRVQWLYDQGSVDRNTSISLFYDVVVRPLLKPPYNTYSWGDMAQTRT